MFYYNLLILAHYFIIVLYMIYNSSYFRNNVEEVIEIEAGGIGNEPNIDDSDDMENDDVNGPANNNNSAEPRLKVEGDSSSDELGENSGLKNIKISVNNEVTDH